MLGDSSFIRKKLGIAEGEIRPWIDHHDSGVPLDLLRTRRLLNLTNPCQFGRFPLSKVKTPVPKRIAVIGAGLAGMLFASIAAGRGHSVTLFEKTLSQVDSYTSRAKLKITKIMINGLIY